MGLSIHLDGHLVKEQILVPQPFKISSQVTNIRIEKQGTQATDTTTLEKNHLCSKRRARRIRTPPDWVHGEG